LILQKEAAAAVNMSQYAIKGSDSDWAKALGGDSAVKNIVSIKGFKYVVCLSVGRGSA
jgi:hypothetical protein